MKFVAFGVLLGLMLAGVGCKTHAPQPKTSAKPSPSPAASSSVPDSADLLDDKTVEQRAEAFARYASGISYELNEKNDQALDEFYKSALANPANERLVIELATQFSQKKENSKAISILQKSCARPEATGAVYAMLAQVYLHDGKTNSALQNAQIAIRKSPKILAGYEALANIYSTTDKPQETLKTLDRAATAIEPQPAALITLADFYASYAKLHPKEKEALAPKAKALLKRATGQPTSILLRQKLADTLAFFGEPKQATDVYLKLLSEQDDSEGDGWRDLWREKLANLFLMQNDKTNAAEQLEGIIRDNPTKYPHAYYILGTISYDQKNFGRAAECFEKAMLLNPQLEAAYYDLAAARINLNDANRALGVLEKARAKFKETFACEFFAAIAYNKLKNYGEAIQHYTAAEIIAKASDTNRLDQTFYFQVGACYERSKNYSDAEKYFEKALEKAPNDAETLNYLGYMWAEHGTNLVKARELIEKAVKLEPKNAAYLDSMAWVLFKLKEPQQALPYILKAIELSPEPDPAVYDHLGDIYAALKQPEKAQEAWKKSISLEPNDDIKKKLSQTL